MTDTPDVTAQMEEILRQSADAAAETRAAFERIMDECDALDEAQPDSAPARAAVAAIYEAAAVQDVLRQRMERIARIAARVIDPTLPDDDPLLAGPQSGNKGLQQHEVNKLLEDFD